MTDDDGFSLKMFADVGLKLSSAIDENTRALDRQWRRMQADTPVHYRPVASGVAESGIVLPLILGKPDAGTLWEVNAVTVGGSTYSTTAAGTAGLYRVSYPISSEPAITDLVDWASSLPSVAFYSSRQVIVREGEWLALVVSGGTAGQLYAAAASVTVTPVGATHGRDVTVAP